MTTPDDTAAPAPARLSTRLLWPAVAGLGVLLLTLPFGAWPSPGRIAWLDSFALRTPADFALVRAAGWAVLTAVLVAAADLVPDVVRRLLARGGRRAGAGLARQAVRLLRRIDRTLTLRILLSLAAGAAVFRWTARTRPFPPIGDDPILDLIALHDPAVHALFRVWYLAVPGLLAFAAVLLLSGARRLWLESRPDSERRGRGVLPPWPASPEDDAPSLVVGELHHPIEAKEVPQPEWLTIPERGLYTGVAIFGAVGTGKTSGCMRPFAEQLLTWQADNPRKRAAALVLEVKGDFCYDIRQILSDAGRGDDYIELTLGGRWQWNPLASDLDSYSLAYSLATLLNQLFGRGKDPFWQQASTNLVRWIIELHRVFPSGWVTLRDVYRLTIDPEALKQKIDAAHALCERAAVESRVRIPAEHARHPELEELPFELGTAGQLIGPDSPDTRTRLDELGVPWERVATRPVPPDDRRARLAAVERWYAHDWMELTPKLRTAIVEAISVFLSIFDLPETARLFSPPSPSGRPGPAYASDVDATGAQGDASETDARVAGGTLAPLPPLSELIEGGKVIALNMPAGANPALARAIGVLLKNAWLQTLLRRPAQMKRNPDRYFRPAVFLCDEYQSFATVGEDDPSGDEKSFALTRQCKCIPIVATQSIASLRSVLAGNDAWRTLLQTLRTRIFLALSDDSSADLASNICGKVARLSPSYSFSESSKPALSLVTGRAGSGQGGNIGASKTYREQREPMFFPRTFTLLQNYQAIALPYDGARSLPATRVYLKPHYLPRDRSYWRARAAGDI